VSHQNDNSQQERHVIASPNPTVDDSKSGAADDAGKVTATRIRPTQATSDAPLKTTTAKPKPKRRRTKPRND
jgi:hypothetical protein